MQSVTDQAELEQPRQVPRSRNRFLSDGESLHNHGRDPGAQSSAETWRCRNSTSSSRDLGKRQQLLPRVPF